MNDHYRHVLGPEGVERYYRKRTGERSSIRRLAHEGRIVRRLLGPLAPGSWVVDMPCGIGVHSRWLAEAGARVIAVDLSPHMLAHAIQDAHPRVAALADARALPLANDVADAAIVIRLMRYLRTAEERRAVLREARRVARRRVVISFVHPIAFAYLVGRRPTRSTLDITTLQADAKACGLRVVKLRPLTPFVKRMWFAALERI